MADNKIELDAGEFIDRLVAEFSSDLGNLRKMNVQLSMVNEKLNEKVASLESQNEMLSTEYARVSSGNGPGLEEIK